MKRREWVVIGVKLIKISVIYFFAAVLFGLFMSMTYEFQYTGVHAHLALLGWTSMTLAGLIYHLFPRAEKSNLGKWHFWLHNISLPIMLGSLFMVIRGYEAFGPIIGIGGITLAIGVVLFVINVFRNVK
ncbi:cbb3-type cytochrome c oxidase subunit I [Thalassorhabdus alkalitolerans]|uniref:Cbb3-type cytochrome c oxidase subunit I n=1 Tax=Thalassorhabdus alkalitolerans TaxID=2282697 RepID=A0ABW0YPG2_9BACI|nr:MULTISPECIES: cbb3-type cytochrome c oxidase subunit I [Bacillaceae]